jgi:hypothetical protein
LFEKPFAQENRVSGAFIKLSGTVQKLIDSRDTQQPQQAQIHLSGADYLYDELRILNSHNWKAGRVSKSRFACCNKPGNDGLQKRKINHELDV